MPQGFKANPGLQLANAFSVKDIPAGYIQSRHEHENS
jgi:hypothetical protein